MSYIVVGILWLWITITIGGPLNVALRAARARLFAMPWLGDPKTASALPHLRHELDVGGLHMVVLLACTALLPRSVIEAAELRST